MSLVTARVGFCRLSGRDIPATLPSRVESPVCHKCTMRLLFRPGRPMPPHAESLPVEVRGLVATGHDPEARREFRMFALSLLEDRGQATEDDRRLLRALLLANPTMEQATEAHGAALSGPRVPRAAPDALPNRERGRRAPGEAGESTEEPTWR